MSNIINIVLIVSAYFCAISSAQTTGSNVAPLKCGKNEVFNSCSSSCPPVCGQAPRFCIAACKPACECSPDFIRSSGNGSCIPLSRCKPKAPKPPTIKCGANQKYSRCGRDKKCGEKKATGNRGKGCFCVKGTVRNENNECIAKGQCSLNGDTIRVTNTPTKVCAVNEEYTFGVCDKRCGLTVECTGPLKEGCFCQMGYSRNAENVCTPSEMC